MSTSNIEPELWITRSKDPRYQDIKRHTGEWLGQITKHNGTYVYVVHKTICELYLQPHELYQICNHIWGENQKEEMGTRRAQPSI